MNGVRINRRLGSGLKAITQVFPGLDSDPGFCGIFSDGLRGKVLAETRVHLVPEDTYAYIDDKRGNVVLGLEYLRTGDERTLYLDILHELVHIRQWHEGQELWDRRFAYVDRPTEIEAYRVAVASAREMGMSDREISDYLRVEWTSRAEHERLCRHLGVKSPESRAH